MPIAVADTHAVVWHLYDDPRLPKTVQEYFQEAAAAGHHIAVSAITLIEIVHLTEKGRIPADALALLQQRWAETRPLFEIVPVSDAIALAVRRVPRAQVPDLPDRVIAATALHLAIPLISRDRKIQLSQVPTIW